MTLKWLSMFGRSAAIGAALFGLLSCKQASSTEEKSKEEVMAETIDYWLGRRLELPRDVGMLTVSGDSANAEFPTEEYKIVRYVGPEGCSSCKMHLSSYPELLDDLEDDTGRRLGFVCIVCPADRKELRRMLWSDNQARLTIWVDEADTLNRLNNFPTALALQTFLVDGNDRVVALGDPVDPNVMKLYVELLTGRQAQPGVVPAEAGANRGELEAVLTRYREGGEPLKLRAAEFLISHMGLHRSPRGGAMVADAAVVGGDFLVEHIEHAFGQWESSAYARSLSFGEFCEYLLPYRAAEGYGGRHESGRERYEWVKTHIGLPDTVADLKALLWHYNNRVLEAGPLGSDCLDKAVQTCLNLRAAGVPCVVEHTIGYRTLRAHHYYCAAWDAAAGRWVRFHGEGVKYYPGDDDWTSAELMNVYRETYAPQPEAEVYMADAERPYRFGSPCQTDVTHHTVRVSVPADGDLQGCVPYLTTFHRTRRGALQPFTPGRRRKDGTMEFERAVPGVWYVVTVYLRGRERVVSRPFWVREDSAGRGYVEFADFQGSAGVGERVVLRRKYPVKDFLVERARTLIGSTIEGADRADFADARTLWRLDSLPQPRVRRYELASTGPYRHYRLRTPGACEVSELQWLGADGAVIAPADEANKAYDGDMTTAPTDSTAITLSLRQPQRVVAVNLAPVNADNAIVPGHRYELYTWRDYRGWVLHAGCVARADSLVFDRVPRGALLWLRNCTAGQEEMPMFYADGHQQFIYEPYNNHPGVARVI